VRRRKFCREFFLSGFRPLAVDELEEIKSDPDAVDPDQLRDVLNMIDVVVERAFFCSRAHEDGLDADYPAPLANHLDLSIPNSSTPSIVMRKAIETGH
jgi:hypothetical protein